MRNLRRGRDDHRDMPLRSSSWNDRQVDAFLAGHGSGLDAPLAAAITELRALATASPPKPSAALTALLDAVTPVPLITAAPTPVRRARRRGRRSAVLAIVAAALVTTAGTAANALPGVAQRASASFLNAVTPFHFPTSGGDAPTPTPVHPPAAPDLLPGGGTGVEDPGAGGAGSGTGAGGTGVGSGTDRSELTKPAETGTAGEGRDAPGGGTGETGDGQFPRSSTSTEGTGSSSTGSDGTGSDGTGAGTATGGSVPTSAGTGDSDSQPTASASPSPAAAPSPTPTSSDAVATTDSGTAVTPEASP